MCLCPKNRHVHFHGVNTSFFKEVDTSINRNMYEKTSLVLHLFFIWNKFGASAVAFLERTILFYPNHKIISFLYETLHAGRA